MEFPVLSTQIWIPILGGLAVSTIFTVFVIPAILIFVIRMEKRKTSQLPQEAS